MKFSKIKITKTKDKVLCNITYEKEVVKVGYKTDGTPFLPNVKKNEDYKSKLNDIGTRITRISSKMWSEARELGMWDEIEFTNKEKFGKQLRFLSKLGYDCANMAMYGEKSNIDLKEALKGI